MAGYVFVHIVCSLDEGCAAEMKTSPLHFNCGILGLFRLTWLQSQPFDFQCLHLSAEALRRAAAKPLDLYAAAGESPFAIPARNF